MKKLSLFLALILLVPGAAFAYNADGNPYTLEEHAGSVAEPVRVYTLVRFAQNNQNGVTLSQGDVVIWDTVSDDGVTVGLVGTVGSSDAVAGVVVSATIPTSDVAGTAIGNIGNRNWGYIQVYGLSTVTNITAGPAAAGRAIIASDIPRYATAQRSYAVDSNTDGRGFGFAYDASSDGQAEAFINSR